MKYPSMLQRIPSHGARPLRIGVWCDYGFTLTRVWGIGVFVYSLVEGLSGRVQLDPVTGPSDIVSRGSP